MAERDPDAMLRVADSIIAIVGEGGGDRKGAAVKALITSIRRSRQTTER
jgi:hypothetical protein